MGGSISCPSEFITGPNGIGCVIPCPTDRNYQMTSNGPIISCTHTADPNARIPLVVVPSYWIPDGSSLQPNASYTTIPNNDAYANEFKRFNDALAVADANINRNTKITAAFNTLQAAENARDTAPDAYQAARVAYYTLIKGDTWLNDEKTRVANIEAQPVINSILEKYKSIESRRSQQQSTIDAMKGVKDTILSVKDDLSFSVSNFQRQIGDVTNQINKDKRSQTVQLAQAKTWVEVLLNWLIVLATLLAIFLLIRYFMRPKPVASTRPALGSQPTSPVR